MHRDLHDFGAVELRAMIEAREISPVEATEVALMRAETIGRDLRAFVTLDGERARKAARDAERALVQGGPLGPLHGVPITVKDLMLTRGLPTTAGSRAFGSGLPGDKDATVVRRLWRAGAVLIGKTNLNEFAYGVTGENAHFGDVLNPWDRTRMTGGSSSGSGAALAAGIGYGSVGTDTRGSIRIPAALCGITGIKPTRGLVPTDGVFPLSETLDHTGPMARSVEDVALMLGVMARGGGDPGRFMSALAGGVKGLKLGVPEFFFRGLDEEVEPAVRTAISVLAGAGMEVRELEITGLDECLAASAVISGAEAAVVHDERLRAGGKGYGPAVLARLDTALGLRALDLVRAQTVRANLIRAFRRSFRDIDCMIGPTLPGLAAPWGRTTMRVAGGREEALVEAHCRLVAPQNMTGVPALSLPCGFGQGGLPIGLQIWGAAGADATVLKVGHYFQRQTDWHRRRPSPGSPS